METLLTDDHCTAPVRGPSSAAAASTLSSSVSTEQCRQALLPTSADPLLSFTVPTAPSSAGKTRLKLTMGIPRVNLVVNPNPCLEKPALSHSKIPRPAALQGYCRHWCVTVVRWCLFNKWASTLIVQAYVWKCKHWQKLISPYNVILQQ